MSDVTEEIFGNKKVSQSEDANADPAKIIDDYFSSNYQDWGGYTPLGADAVEEAKRAGIDLALGMAMVEKESAGRNIFGCDGGDVGDTPPYCHQRVTQARARALMASPYMNGCGVCQLTWWEFLEEAEREGGAHLPKYQMRVGFRVLQNLISKYSYLEALGGYNAGEFNRLVGVNNGYAADVAAKQLEWKRRLAGAEDSKPPPTPTEWPTEIVSVSDSRWLYGKESNKWLKAPSLPDGTKLVIEDGQWLRVVEGQTPIDPKPSDWKWPEDNDAPQSWGDYVQRHPTRYTWRPDVESIARRIADKYSGQVWPVTYHDHPESYWRDEDSIDFWAYEGRGTPIDPSLGQSIFNELFNDPNKPDIEWIIFRAVIYGAWNGWKGEGFGYDDFTWHYDHIHVTYLK